MVTLLAYLARASETSGNARAGGVLRALGAQAQAPGGRDAQGRGGARRRPRRRGRAAGRVEGREGRAPGRLPRRHRGRGVRPPRGARSASDPSTRARASPRTPSRPRGSPRCGSTTRAAPPAPARPPAAAPPACARSSRRMRLLPLSDSGALAAISAAIAPAALLELGRLDHVVHQADLGAPLGVDVAAHVEQLGGVRRADHVEELPQARVRVDEPELGRRHPELDPARGDPDVAGERQLQPAADRVAVERADHRDRGTPRAPRSRSGTGAPPASRRSPRTRAPRGCRGRSPRRTPGPVPVSTRQRASSPATVSASVSRISWSSAPRRSSLWIRRRTTPSAGSSRRSLPGGELGGSLEHDQHVALAHRLALLALDLGRPCRRPRPRRASPSSSTRGSRPCRPPRSRRRPRTRSSRRCR